MNDRYKFRAWHHGAGDPRVSGHMRYSDFSLELFWKNVENEDLGVEIMQSTGLLDKNGKLVFEGDYIKIKGATANENDFDGEVIFKDGTFCLKSKHQPKDKAYIECVRFWNDGCHEHHSLEMIESYEMEIIGNIYQDSHLLENKDDNIPDN